jgi:hypothetical protein
MAEVIALESAHPARKRPYLIRIDQIDGVESFGSGPTVLIRLKDTLDVLLVTREAVLAAPYSISSRLNCSASSS